MTPYTFPLGSSDARPQLTARVSQDIRYACAPSKRVYCTLRLVAMSEGALLLGPAALYPLSHETLNTYFLLGTQLFLYMRRRMYAKAWSGPCRRRR